VQLDSGCWRLLAQPGEEPADLVAGQPDQLVSVWVLGIRPGTGHHSDADAHHAHLPARLARILVIEDEHAIRDANTYTLHADGYQVTEAATGQEGLSAARREHFDLIIIDMLLPDIPGTDLTRQLRDGGSSSDGDGTRILAITAHTGAGTRDRGAAPTGSSAVSSWYPRPRPRSPPHRRQGETAHGLSRRCARYRSRSSSRPPAPAVAHLRLCRPRHPQQQPRRRRPVPDRVRRDLAARDHEILRPGRRQARPHRPPRRHPTHRPQVISTEPHSARHGETRRSGPPR
jgi:CheY-like chemotaxis protein